MNAARVRRTFVALILVLLIVSGFARHPAARAIPANTTSGPRLQDPKQDQDDVIRVSTELVVVNATVLDKSGKFVSGLKTTDFQLFEDGTVQKIVSFTNEITPFAAAVLLDTSGSMEPRLTLGRSAALRFLDGLRENDVARLLPMSEAETEKGSDLMKINISFLAALLLVGTDLVARAAMQGVELAFVLTAFEYSYSWAKRLSRWARALFIDEIN